MDDLKELAIQCGVPEAVVDRITRHGYTTPSLFAFSFSTPAALDTKILEWLADDGEPEDEEACLISPQAGAIRALWHHSFHQIHNPSLAPAPSASETPSLESRLAWTDLPPPKLSAEHVLQLKSKFREHYPGELLTASNTPCLRLLSQVMHQTKPGNCLEWLPWKSLVSEENWNRAQEAKVSKTFKPGSALLASALVEDVPELDDIQGNPFFLSRVLEVRRNAYVLVGIAHLGAWKEIDSKVMDHYTKTYSESSGLRPPSLQEFLQCDRKLWETIFHLVNAEQWELNQALLEVSRVRSDIPTLFMPRPRALSISKGGKSKGKLAWRPNPYDKPAGKGKTKGKGGKADSAKAPAWPDHWAKTLITPDGASQEVCKRFHTTGCNFPKCKFLHRCPILLPSGSPCNLPHKASEHPVMHA